MVNGLLGTDKDVEALVRRARRAGWTVDTDGGTHLRWRDPDGGSFRSPLTGGRSSRQRVERQLAARDPVRFSALAPALARRAGHGSPSPERTVKCPDELAVAAAELAALVELLDELVDGGELNVDQLASGADAVRIGRSLLRDAEDAIRHAVRAARRG